jgi:hypothetical protein
LKQNTLLAIDGNGNKVSVHSNGFPPPRKKKPTHTQKRKLLGSFYSLNPHFTNVDFTVHFFSFWFSFLLNQMEWNSDLRESATDPPVLSPISLLWVWECAH